MDRNHRDRIAFARICSGKFDRGMVMTCERTGKPFATKYASTVFGAERTTIDEAFPGDVVGLVNATGLNIGDTLYDETGPPVEFPKLPQFAPEVFATARPQDSGKVKQFRKGLDQLGEEGVVQVLRDPDWGEASPVLAAVGQLQFDVFANRLDIEFNAPIELSGLAVPGDPPHRPGVGGAAPREAGRPDPPAHRRRAGCAVREQVRTPAHRAERTRPHARPHRRLTPGCAPPVRPGGSRARRRRVASAPSRTTVRRMVSPGSRAPIASPTVSGVSTASPSIAVITSPARSPATSAADPTRHVHHHRAAQVAGAARHRAALRSRG